VNEKKKRNKSMVNEKSKMEQLIIANTVTPNRGDIINDSSSLSNGLNYNKSTTL